MKHASGFPWAGVPVLAVLVMSGCAGKESHELNEEFRTTGEREIPREETLDTVDHWDALAHLMVISEGPQGPYQDEDPTGEIPEEILEGKIYGPFQEDFLGTSAYEVLARLALGMSYHTMSEDGFPDAWRLTALTDYGLSHAGWFAVGFYGGTGLGTGTVEDEPLKILYELGLTLRYRGSFGKPSGGPHWMFAGDMGVLVTRAGDGPRYYNGSVSLVGGLGWEFDAGRETRLGLHGFLARRWLTEGWDNGDIQPGLAKSTWEAGAAFRVFFPARMTDFF